MKLIFNIGYLFYEKLYQMYERGDPTQSDILEHSIELIDNDFETHPRPDEFWDTDLFQYIDFRLDVKKLI